MRLGIIRAHMLGRYLFKLKKQYQVGLTKVMRIRKL